MTAIDETRPQPASPTSGRWPLRLIVLLIGLYLYGLSAALMLRSDLGAMPWDVLHQGIAIHTPISIGMVSIVVAVIVLALWIPIRQRPGVGTVCNVVLVGASIDLMMAVVPPVHQLWLRIGLMVVGVVLNAFATVLYIGANLGPGPRDGLMTGLVRRTGGSIRLIRTGIEVTVVAIGWVLGGTLGVGTVLYAMGVGPLIQVFARRSRLPGWSD